MSNLERRLYCERSVNAGREGTAACRARSRVTCATVVPTRVGRQQPAPALGRLQPPCTPLAFPQCCWGAWASPVSEVMFPVGFPVLEGWWGPGMPCDPAGSGPRGRCTSCSSPRRAGFGAGAACQPRHPTVSGPSAIGLAGSRGRSISLPAAAGMGLERCRGRSLGAVICIQGGCGARGVCSWLRSWGERVSGPAGNGAAEILRSLSVSLSVLYQSRLEGCGVPSLCASEACNRSSLWRISIKCHEKPILQLIWLKQVGHQDRNAPRSWHQWLRGVFPSRAGSCVGAGGDAGPQRSGGLRGAGGRWGGCSRALASRQWRLQSIVWAMWRVLPGSRKRVHPGGAEPGCVCRGWACGRFVHRPRSIDHLSSAGGLWLGCSRGPWRISPPVPAPCFSAIFSAVLIPLTLPFVSPT